MYYLILTIHFILCFSLIILVLIQQGKGADMGAAFGGGGSNTFFGASGATAFITKLTTGIAIAFMVTSIGLIYFDPVSSGAIPSLFQPKDKIQDIMDARAPQQASPAQGSPEQAASAQQAPQPAAAQPAAPQAQDSQPAQNAGQNEGGAVENSEKK